MTDIVEGIIIVLDLDQFEEYTLEHGFDQFKPNIITGTLTRLLDLFIRKWHAVVIYGYDENRGTEEAVLEIPYGVSNIEDLYADLDRIKKEINKLGASISIVVVRDFITGRPARNRSEAYYGSPGRRRAIRLLKKIKRKGGNKILVLV